MDGFIFKVNEIADYIEQLPNSFSLLGNSGIFSTIVLSQSQFYIEESESELSILSSKKINSPTDYNSPQKRSARLFQVPTYKLQDVLRAADLNGFRAFGEMGLEAVAREAANKLLNMKRKHDLTHEYSRLGAIKGKLVDPSGEVICDAFKEFGITKKTINFELNKDTTSVKQKCNEVLRYIDNNLRGEIRTGVRCYVDAQFFDMLTNHPSVIKVFLNTSQAESRLSNDNRNSFYYGGIEFVEYTGTVTTSTGSKAPLIDEATGNALPLGTLNSFKQYIAPAAFLDTVNSMGQLINVRTAIDKFGTEQEIYTESNYFALCKRPSLLVELKAA